MSSAMKDKKIPPMPDTKHPYYPWDLQLPHYVPNTKSTGEILAVLAVVATVIFIVSWIVSGRRKEPFCITRRLVLCWFMMCAFIHTIIEGYFTVYHTNLAGHTTLLGQMWKEYSKCDSRYLSSDTFVVCMESITAIVYGPLAFITFFAFLRGSNYRYAFQLMLSLCQLYGDSLYFLTEIKDGFIHGIHGHPLYFGFYFTFLNGLWIVIPICLIFDAVRHIAECQIRSDIYIDEQNSKHGNNYKKKVK